MSEYLLHSPDPFNRLALSVVEREIRSGNTVSLVALVDLTKVEALRARRPGGSRPSYTALVAKAVALALKEFPYANRRLFRPLGLPFLPRRIQSFKEVDLSVACEVDLPGQSTVFVDILRRANEQSLEQISAWLRALARSDTSNNKQWRQYHWAITRLPSLLTSWIVRLPLFVPRLWDRWRGGAVLISSPAKYGVDLVIASWTSPLGISFGLVKERALVVDGAVVARPSFNLLLNFDRRLMAGAPAARFFKRIVDLLEDPESLAAPGERQRPVQTALEPQKSTEPLCQPC